MTEIKSYRITDIHPQDSWYDCEGYEIIGMIVEVTRIYDDIGHPKGFVGLEIKRQKGITCFFAVKTEEV